MEGSGADKSFFDLLEGDQEEGLVGPDDALVKQVCLLLKQEIDAVGNETTRQLGVLLEPKIMAAESEAALSARKASLSECAQLSRLIDGLSERLERRCAGNQHRLFCSQQ